jgi:hypothetical protein
VRQTHYSSAYNGEVGAVVGHLVMVQSGGYRGMSGVWFLGGRRGRFGGIFFAYKYKGGETKKNAFFGWSWAGGFSAAVSLHNRVAPLLEIEATDVLRRKAFPT